MRGNGLLALLGIEGARVGLEEIKNRLSTVPPPVLATLKLDQPTFGLDPDAWYAPALVHAVVDAAMRGVSDVTAGEIVKDAARIAVAAAMKTRPTFASLDSPERVTRLLNAVWRSAFSDGTFTVLSGGPRRVTVRRTGWTGHHRLICRFGMEAARVLYEQSGAKSAKVSMTSCISDDKPDCSALIEW